ncbi:phenylalanine and histidine ammonia-lyase [Gaeumannomyces tritici R3-111a-1]|uniref:Phenylalanine and histidine ammonia-lyase n=1 Tax=Gaeumannomyces tritici (strain R3-111a-1) TaxID=644352 RepID=J3NHV1_GAET3|nr:phenylalanine and histidine ammonia-lyase [Gaeumannomyces tritici R3-111a-1]EJT80844.1 phenylalanine and histidine ammonia-lyase [Gaeumannomyces tritici R3-111a-1]
MPFGNTMSFSALLTSHWQELRKAKLAEDSIIVNGRTLTLGAVVAVARSTDPKLNIDATALAGIPVSADLIINSISRGQVIYGVNTGFGGNADTRVVLAVVEALQRALIRSKHCGILQPALRSQDQHATSNGTRNGHVKAHSLQLSIPLDHPEATTCMPESWVRATMLIRLNSLLGGASGVQPVTVETLVSLLNNDIVPLMPLRGSISASGDLSPLSYIAGAMQGAPGLSVYTGSRSSDGRRCVRADKALGEADIKPIHLGPKEGLAIVNGTAVSAGVASLALHESLCLAGLSQVLTAMSVEAFLGTDESFDPFIAEMRPHPGQVDSARTIHAFLRGSKLARHNDGKDSVLRQDRYSLRTASQWIGPVLEDFSLSYDQLTTEVNSVTDNPLVDTARGRILHGGNFQAKAVTSAVEKLRQGLQSLGRLHFEQCKDLFNPDTNRGLPPNLVVDEPSGSYLWKGVDIMTAAATSELGFLAGNVGAHVMTAELGNQGINSIALISARYTLMAVECLSQLMAAHLLALCQALDLRVMWEEFRCDWRPSFDRLFRESFGGMFPDGAMADLAALLWAVFFNPESFNRRKDLRDMFNQASRAMLAPIMEMLGKFSAEDTKSFPVLELQKFVRDCSASASTQFLETRTKYRRAAARAALYLGGATQRMYLYVRRDLGVPFLGEEELESATPTTINGCGDGVETNGATKHYPGTFLPDATPTVGSYLTTIYEAIRNGELYGEVVGCFEEVKLE